MKPLTLILRDPDYQNIFALACAGLICVWLVGFA